MLNNIKTMKEQRGFTIVELLIVIVVIAILAAITIVAYNGIQNRAKTSAGQSAANSLIKKAEAANTLASSYPSAVGDFSTNSESSLSGSGITLGTPTATNSPSTVSYQKCSTPAGTNGGRVGYWDYTSGSGAIAYINFGTSCTAWAATLTGGPY